MRTVKCNGEEWYVDERSLWKRCRQWVLYIGGWEKPNGQGWHQLRLSHPKRIRNPTPISLFGHRMTFFGWGGRISLSPYRSWALVWSKDAGGRRIFISEDGSRPDAQTRGVYLYKSRYPSLKKILKKYD